MELTIHVELDADEIKEAIEDGRFNVNDIFEDSEIIDYVSNDSDLIKMVNQNIEICDILDDDDIIEYCNGNFEITQIYSEEQVEERVNNDTSLKNNIIERYLRNESLFDITTKINTTISREAKLLLIRLLLENNDQDFAKDVVELTFKNYEKFLQ